MSAPGSSVKYSRCLSEGIMRTIRVNQRVQATKFCSNAISTSKYNFITFLPKFLFDQFKKYANIFFLIVATLQQIPGISPTGRFTTLVPLVVILSISAIKEAVEDFKRRKADRRLNKKNTFVFRSDAYLEPRWEMTRWKSVNVGDIVKISANELFPADLFLLSSSEPNSLCYLQTSNLDGETNLKIRQGLPRLSSLIDSNHLKEFKAEIDCENPNQHLYEFAGNLRIENESDVIPIGPDQILLRGSQLQNTKWVYGVVIYTGHESKLMMNSNSPPFKRSQVEKTTNTLTVILFSILMLFTLFSTMASQTWFDHHGHRHWYIPFGVHDNMSNSFIYTFMTFFILYNNLIPISLQVALELIKFVQAFFINWDKDMYDHENGFAAVARTSNLNEELGQIKYIFSDKTGTLTCNKMQFKRCTVGGVCYGSGNEAEFNSYELLKNLREHATRKYIDEFLTLLATCHTVIPEKKEDGAVDYQASSPDERAIVKEMQSIGIVFDSRTPTKLVIKFFQEEREFHVLNVLEFNSDRKRMSVILRDSSGKIKLYCKGADNVILSRALKETNVDFIDLTLEHLENFAKEGLRTLVVAYREISQHEYDSWNKLYTSASTSLQERDKKIQEAAELIEKDLVVLGGTAIEDKLQLGVPSTITMLKKAGIKFWILTGDKIETAVNIGYSCGLLTEDTNLVYLVDEKFTDVKTKLRLCRTSLDSKNKDSIGLIIDGKSLVFALSTECESDFLDIATSCRSVICCRATPKNKAQIVDFIKRKTKEVTLAIGDGANDVSMIQAAHVGVGIYGREGTQALSASDYAIGQFRFLAKLLLVHGIWNYKRLSKAILYSFYKNICFYIIASWFSLSNGFSGQILFERWLKAFYNISFTAFPPIVLGLFDRPCKASTMLKHPELYKTTQKNSDFNLFVFTSWMLNAFTHSLLIYVFSYFILQHEVAFEDGTTGDVMFFGNHVLTYCVIVVCLKAGLETDSWTKMTFVSIFGSIASWFLFLFVYSCIAPRVGLSPQMLGIAVQLFHAPLFWLGMIFVPTTVFLPDVIGKAIKRTVWKTSLQKVQEDETRVRKNDDAERPVKRSKFVKTTRMSNSALRTKAGPRASQRGFAFSQEEGGPVRQSELIRFYDTNLDKPASV